MTQIAFRIPIPLLAALDLTGARTNQNRGEAAKSILEKYFSPFRVVRTIAHGETHSSEMLSSFDTLGTDCQRLGEWKKKQRELPGDSAAKRNSQHRKDKSGVLAIRSDRDFKALISFISKLSRLTLKSISEMAAEAITVLAIKDLVAADLSAEAADRIYGDWLEFFNEYQNCLKQTNRLLGGVTNKKDVNLNQHVLRHSFAVEEALSISLRLENLCRRRRIPIV